MSRRFFDADKVINGLRQLSKQLRCPFSDDNDSVNSIVLCGSEIFVEKNLRECTPTTLSTIGQSYVCGECHKIFPKRIADSPEDVNYCPFCGAKFH